MPSTQKVLLVVPCYNEAHRLDRRAFEGALAEMGWLSLCFVDDGSTDATASLLRDMLERWPERIEILTLPRNAGKGEAVRRGLLHALHRSEICGFWDADLSAPLSELASLRRVFTSEPGVQWVWGIRLRALGREVTRRATRHYLGRGFATLCSALLGLEAYDTQCGAKLFRATPLLATVLSTPFDSRWIFDVELLARANALIHSSGVSTLQQLVYEQPLARWHHQPGSKVRATDFARAVIELLHIRKRQREWARPGLVSTSGPPGANDAVDPRDKCAAP